MDPSVLHHPHIIKLHVKRILNFHTNFRLMTNTTLSVLTN